MTAGPTEAAQPGDSGAPFEAPRPDSAPTNVDDSEMESDGISIGKLSQLFTTMQPHLNVSIQLPSCSFVHSGLLLRDLFVCRVVTREIVYSSIWLIRSPRKSNRPDERADRIEQFSLIRS